ncbi:SusC/RagA family TonB-linked outer membrane protein [Algibacter amylolyticus]|uniref:SusC/RagA family TonB-linked outer membrane protein n=1 Tax=Algibacter amylolyticus TaxID=1608400 RepID=A0A5M7BF73_9FLAO|nr:SusC/RagA family TonB-linked outer membrane protein [Algibacter amylolyticus]KAA5828012.1 SusC/RagA family TonB-linked outer membrane protein [Algibacter amylolyticus]MBB5267255.1 iron complex outermembrane receptor protein [Algibacter amylolyticus]TSJ82257.1 SusC/RagA family TonB-linked outer membrane protein [Algibacter amylolyticus]
MKTTINSLLFFLFLAPIHIFGQTPITGSVTEQSTSIPLPGVNVVVKGTNNGTATDFDGNYRIEVNNGDVIVFSYIGFQPKEVIYSGQTTLDVQLTEDTSQLDEIVIIGYGSVKKEDLTGAVDVISAKDFNQGAVVSPDQLLQGKAAGVRITSAGGQPDAAPNIRIRGGSSLSGNNAPLIVIDGVPLDNGGVAGVGNPLSLINPNDIESFSILKDASATAIYGSRASNGVLIITTKKGTSGETKFNFSARTSLSNISSNDQVPVMNGNEFVQFAQTYFPDNIDALGVPVGSVDTNQPIAQIISTPNGDRAIYNTDWQDVIYRTAVTKDYNFGVRGNLLKKIPVRASVGYNETEGVVQTNDYERITASLRLTPKFFDDHLKVDINAKGTVVDKNSIDDGAALGGAISMDPTKPVYDANSIFGGFYQQLQASDNPNNPNAKIGAGNPLGVLLQRTRPEKVNRLLGNIELDYKFHFLPELRAVVNLGLEASRAEITETFSDNAINSYAQIASADPSAPLPIGTFILQPGLSYAENQHITNVTGEYYLAYRKEFDDLFINNFDVQAGYSYQNFKNDGNKKIFQSDPAYDADKIAGVDYDLDSDGVTGDRVRNLNPNNPNDRFFNELNLQSFFGRANINLTNKYLLTASFRADASSFFTEENRWGYFPSAALAWKVKEESFLKDVNFVNDFKLRFGWGETGQQDISGQVGFYPSIPLFEIGDANSQYIEGVNLYDAKEFNPDLTWEKSTTYNLGVDFDFFKNSFLSGSFDIFKRETTDLLVLTGVSPGSALSDQVIKNVGSTESKGFELNLNLNPVQNEVFNLSFNGNLSYNFTEVTDLEGVEQINAPDGGLAIGTGNILLRHALGEQAGSAWVLKQVYDTAGDPILGSFVDLNDDGRITEADRYYRAIQPNWTFGFGFNMNYKNWDFSASFRGQLDGEIYNSRRLTHGAIENALALDGNSFNNTLNFYSGEASTVFTDIVDPVQYSDYFLEGASFLRCENIVIGHTLTNVIKNASLKIYGAVNNPFLITNYSGQDPENFNGIDNDFYPRATIYNLGVNIDF